MSAARRSLREEGQLVLADLELVPVLERPRLDPAPVQERPVQAPPVLDEELAVPTHDERVAAGDRDVVEEDVAVRRAADRRLLLVEKEVLSGAASSGTDDERGPLGLDLVEDRPRLVLALLRRVTHRRVRATLVADEERSAFRAVVRRLGVLEAALGTIDVTQALSSEGGAAFPARMRASPSTSTCSRTLFPSDFWSRATSSARRMSILPCRRRLRYEISCSSSVRSSMSFFRSSSDSVER